MADGGYGGGGAITAGLGNYKGVMLCNRPSDDGGRGGGCGDGPMPFKSMISATHGEQLGLPPCKRSEEAAAAASGVKKRGPSAALRQHVRWLRELQDQMRGEREQVEEDEKIAEEKKQRMRATVEKHREAVREMREDRDKEDRAKAAAAAALKAAASGKQGKPHSAPASATAKPLWAMSSKEKDDFEEEEADLLINFAENLDFDKYVGDLEFRQGLEALKDRAGRLHKESEAFKDALVRDFNSKIDDDEGRSTEEGSPRSLRLEDGIDGQSLLGDLRSEYSAYSRRSGEERSRKGEKEWDSSTACGDERQKIDEATKDAARTVLENAPHIRAIHSKESVQKIIEKARRTATPEPPPDLIEQMRRDGAVAVPVITASADTQQRLNKPVEPSHLPYLYRSPAV